LKNNSQISPLDIASPVLSISLVEAVYSHSLQRVPVESGETITYNATQTHWAGNGFDSDTD
jgi:hypothetical protein